MESLNNFFAGTNSQVESDSGEPLTTNVVILGLIVALAVGLILMLGSALSDRGDGIVSDIEASDDAWSSVGGS